MIEMFMFARELIQIPIASRPKAIGCDADDAGVIMAEASKETRGGADIALAELA